MFGPIHLDVDAPAALSGMGNVLVPPKALDVLQVLLENRGRTVEKDDLMRPSVAGYGRRRGEPDAERVHAAAGAWRRTVGSPLHFHRRPSRVSIRRQRVETGSECRAGRATASASDGESGGIPRVRERKTLLVETRCRGVRAAIAFFRQAIDRDPTYALAYVGLAEVFVMLWVHGWPVAPDAFVTAKAAAARALEIDDTIAEAHATLGAIRMTSDMDWAGAEQSFCMRIELAPGLRDDPQLVRELSSLRNSRFDEAVREAQQAVSARPAERDVAHGRRPHALLGRRYEEAVETELSALEMDPELLAGALGDRDGARATRRRHPARSTALRDADEFSGGNPMVRGVLGRSLALSGTPTKPARSSEPDDRSSWLMRRQRTLWR